MMKKRMKLRLTFLSLLVLSGLTLVLPATVSAAERIDSGDGAVGGTLSSSWLGAGTAAAIFVPLGILLLMGVYFVVRRTRHRDVGQESLTTVTPAPIESEEVPRRKAA
jgi:hypothetical protein